MKKIIKRLCVTLLISINNMIMIYKSYYYMYHIHVYDLGMRPKKLLKTKGHIHGPQFFHPHIPRTFMFTKAIPSMKINEHCMTNCVGDL